ncbi:stage V sporulation protein B [Acetitomaculum ruminis DSM 5522]|uniref:Stage V sporulation protein B n=1 Tax=Acetitomaculum ruminis DSM 5522 TaxID=1120918 RepID=A0A1I0V483_9FIRM|nr:polysaccharide biosynthesis protein [Acetitomaculum ruminis]SFA71149.1 stage V sporulation protein B [Acetitomaculum ruminis DSM 5522]
MSTNSKNRANAFLVQGSILAVASILSRLIGLVYRVVLTRILGDTGNDYYSAAFSLYNIFLLISSYSLPLAVSKLVSASVAKKEIKNSVRIFKAALIFSFVTGSIVACICFFGADFLTNNIMKTPMSYYALKVLAPTLLIVAVAGVIRGYFQGQGTMIPTATSQIIEQLVNAAISIIAAIYLSAYGLKIGTVLGNKEQYRAAFGAAGSTLGTSMGALASIVFLFFLLFVFSKNLRVSRKRRQSSRLDSYSSIYKMILLTVVPVIMSTTIYNINDFLDQPIYKSIMYALGEAEEHISSNWGIYNGKYMVLTTVPITIASALSSSVIPSLTAAVNLDDKQLVKQKIGVSIRFIMVVALPCAVGMGVLASPLLRLLFDESRPLPAIMLQMGAVSIVFYSLSTVTNGILQGINKMMVPVRNAAIALLCHVIFLCIFLFIFKFDIYSVILSMIIFSFVMCLLNSIEVKRATRYRQEIKKTFIIPGISSLIMGIITFFVYKGIYMVIKVNIIATIVAIFVAMVVYAVCLLKLKGFTREELLDIPKGRTIVKLATKFHLLTD